MTYTAVKCRCRCK